MKLDFIQTFYDKSVSPFAATIRQIETHDRPFDVWDGDPKCAEEPFFDEWMNAYDSIATIGACCLCLVHDTLKQFSEELIRKSGQTPPAGKGPWTERYIGFFKSKYNIDWSAASVDLRLLEQLVLARNDLQHSGTLLANHVLQGRDHKRKVGSSMFIERTPPGDTIFVNKQTLTAAIEFVDGLCKFLISQSPFKRFATDYVRPSVLTEE
jgi:hypothetical protein